MFLFFMVLMKNKHGFIKKMLGLLAKAEGEISSNVVKWLKACYVDGSVNFVQSYLDKEIQESNVRL